MHRRASAVSTFFLASATAMTVNAQTAAGAGSGLLPFKITETTLENGLRVIVVPTGFPNLVSIQIPVQTGSRNEVEPGKSGFAHFFEHMMFRGTKEYPPEKYQAVLTAAGARNNAYTTDDYTNYHATFSKDSLDVVLKIEADRFQNLSYEEAPFQTEARAVLGEYNKNSADPVQKLFEVQRERAFTVHPYQHTTMGFLKDIEAMPTQFEYSKVFFDRWYRPEYTTVLVAGDVTAEEVLPLVRKYWGGWKRGTHTVDIPDEPEAGKAVVAHVEWESETLPWVTVAFRTPAFSETEKDYAALDLLSSVAFGPTSDLYRRLVEQEQKADQVGPYLPDHTDPSLLTVYARVKDAADVAYVRDEMLKTVARVRSQALPGKQVADARAHARAALVRQLDSTESIASTLATFVRHRRTTETLERYYKVYDSLTSADLLAAAKRYFTDSRLVQTTLSHGALPAAVAHPPLLASFDAPAGGASDVTVVVEKSPLPLVNLRLAFAAGSAHDPAGKEGLAALAASMIADAGSTALRIDEIKKALFPLGGSFSAQVDKEVTTFVGAVPKESWDEYAETVLPMLTSPGFREEDFARVKDVQLNGLVQDLRSSNEEELAKERLQAKLFAGGPYGHPVLGTEAGIAAATLEDVRDFVKRAYTRGAVTVGIAGDVPDALVEGLRRAVSGLPAGKPLPAPSPKGRRPQGLEVDIVQKETRATAISFGYPIEVTRSHPDFAALWLIRAWLGEHRSSVSHLYERIREVRGLNYGDYAYIEAFPRGMFQFFPDPNIPRRAQLFEVWIRPVVPDNAVMSLKIALHEIEGLIARGMTGEDLESIRSYLTKNVFLMTATQDLRLGYALDSRWYNVGEFTATLRQALAALTVDEVNRVMRKHLQTKDLLVVAITKDAEALKAQLLSKEPTTITYDAPKPPEVLEEDKVIGAKVLPLRPEAVTITPVDEVFAK